MAYDKLKQIADSSDKRKGWDFSKMKTSRDDVPWRYEVVVRQYLKSNDYVLDIGTGGGEKFIKLATFFGRGIGTDISPEMIKTARENVPDDLKEKLSFQIMDAHSLDFDDSTFDVVVNRHAPIYVPEVVRVLKKKGYFITQQVGSNNMKNIVGVFGEQLKLEERNDFDSLIEDFTKAGCAIERKDNYDVSFYVENTPSLVFWLKALPYPSDFNIERDWKKVEDIISKFKTPKGIETNEDRFLLVVRKYLN